MAASDCPICGQNDAVMSVANIIANGTESGSSLGVGYIAGSFAPMVNFTHSHSQLAERLSPPPPPGHLSAFGVMGPVWLFAFVSAFVILDIWQGGFPNLAQYGPIGGFFMWALCLIPAIIIALVVFLPIWLLLHWHPRRKHAWMNDTNYLGGAYYCGRDDVMFDSVGNYGSPESFKQELFADSR